MDVHGYLRASTNKQQASPEVQWEQILRYCKTLGLPEPLKYVDPATSGKVPLREREAGAVLVKSLKRGDHLVVAKLDRAFRKASDCLNMLDECEKRGVHLHVCDLLGMPIDLTKAIGKFLIQILAAVAELERSFISERTSLAMKSRRSKGIGGGRPHYGFKHETRYRMVDGKRVAYKAEVPDPEERRVMKMMLAWRTEDPPWSFDQIREKVNYELKLRTRDGREWSIERIKRAIKAEALLQFKEVHDGRCHEPSR